MEDRAQRIVDTAVELAEQGGFEAVRLRDVAANAGVALGTLYRHFHGKEDLLMAALTQETEGLVAKIKASPPSGATPRERVVGYFKEATATFLRRPKLARAVLRSATSGEPELAGKMRDFNQVLTELIVISLRGKLLNDAPATAEERAIAEILQAVYLSALISWLGDQHGPEGVVRQVAKATELILRDGREFPG